MKKYLMVCLGNICRSPLAEGILKERLKKNNLKGFVDSAGTGAWHVGNLPDERSIEVGKKNGIDISDQRARQFTAVDFKMFDQILVMDKSNLKNVLKLAKTEDDRAKVRLLLDYHPDASLNEVPDPYYGHGLSGFEKVYQMLDLACKTLIVS